MMLKLLQLQYLNMEQKRGLSTVIATVLVILITIAAGAVIAQFAIPFVQKQLNQGSECLPYRGYLQFQDKISTSFYNCKTPNSQYIFALKGGSIDRSLAGNVDGFNLVFIGQGTSTNVAVTSANPNVVTRTGGSSLVPGPGEVNSYSYTSSQTYTYLEISPILKSGKVCEVSDRITLAPC